MLPQQGILPPQRHPIVLPLQGIASVPASSSASLLVDMWGGLSSSSLKSYLREAEDDLDEVGENTPTKCHLVDRNLWLLYAKAIDSDSKTLPSVQCPVLEYCSDLNVQVMFTMALLHIL